MPMLDTYDDTHNTTVVDNFLFGLEQYFDAMGVRDEASKVGTVQLWWRQKYGEMGKGFAPSTHGLGSNANTASTLS